MLGGRIIATPRKEKAMSAMRLALLVTVVLLASPALSWAQRFAPPPVRPPPAPRFAPTPHVVPVRSGGGGGQTDNDWIWWVVGGVFGAVVIWVLIAVFTRKKAVQIRITATPPGEAPEHVRSAWVGLEVPLYPGETGP